MESQIPSEDLRQIPDDLRYYFAILWRWIWLIISATLLAGIAALMVSLRMSPIYQASVTLLVNQAPGSQAADYSAILTSQRLTQTYAEMLVKKPVLNEVIENLELDETVKSLKEVVSVQAIRDTQLIEITVEDEFPVQAADIANEISLVFSDQIQALQESRYTSTKVSLEEQLNELQDEIETVQKALSSLGDSQSEKSELDRLETILSGYRQTYASILQSYEQVRLSEAETISGVIQVESADPPEEPVRPRIYMNTALASIVGGMLAMGAIFLMESLDDTIRGSEDIGPYLGLPVLGVIRKFNEESDLITVIKPRSPGAEDFRSLRTNLQFASVDHPLRTILITSPAPADGKTTVAANLSIILAQGGKKVSLVDVDLRRPKIHQIMRVSNRWGLSALFTNDDTHFNGVIRKNVSSGLSILTTGKLPPNPSELLDSDKMSQIIATLESQSDIVLFDSPPLNAVTDASILSKRVDGVILVVQSGKTKMNAAIHAVEQLHRVKANILGVVINNIGPSNHSYYYSHYYRYDVSDYPSS